MQEAARYAVEDSVPESSRDVTREWTRVSHAAVVRLVRISAIRKRVEKAAQRTFDTCADISSRPSGRTPMCQAVDMDDPHT